MSEFLSAVFLIYCYTKKIHLLLLVAYSYLVYFPCVEEHMFWGTSFNEGLQMSENVLSLLLDDYLTGYRCLD